MRLEVQVANLSRLAACLASLASLAVSGANCGTVRSQHHPFMLPSPISFLTLPCIRRGMSMALEACGKR